MSKHTPGEWQAHQFDDAQWIVKLGTMRQMGGPDRCLLGPRSRGQRPPDLPSLDDPGAGGGVAAVAAGQWDAALRRRDPCGPDGSSGSPALRLQHRGLR